MESGEFVESLVAEMEGIFRQLGEHEEIIHPEEVHHYRMGREYLERHARTPADQERTAAAARTTLAIADELRNLAEKLTGLHPIPVS